MNDIEEVKSRINIVDVIGEKVRLKKSGINYFGLCPFHNEKTSSFSVNENLQIYKCFGCGESGDVITFVTKFNNSTFREALEELAERAGYKLKDSNYGQKDEKFEKEKNEVLEINKLALKFFQENLLKEKDNDGIKYSKKRGLTNEIISKYGIGYASHSSQNLIKYLERYDYKSDQLNKSGLVVKKEGKTTFQDKFKDRLIFSVFDLKGNAVGFSGRYIGPEKKDFVPPKYLNSPETIVFNKSRLLFGLYQAQDHIKKLKFVILTEGQMNVVSSAKVGVGNIVASLGTSFTNQHLELLRRHASNIYLAFDKDTAGKKATLRTLEMIYASDSEMSVKILSWDKSLGKDPDEVIQKNEKYWIECVNNPVDPINYFLHEFSEKYPETTIENINSFLKMIVPLVQKIKNLIRRDEYLKQIAKYFDISLTSLLETFRASNPAKTSFQKEEVIEKQLPKTPDLFDLIFSLFLQNWSSTKELLLGIDRDFIIDDYVELYDCLTLFLDSEDIKGINDQIDEEAAKKIQELAMKPIKLDESLTLEEHILKSIPNLLRIKYQELSGKIAEDPENIHYVNQRNKLAHAIVDFSSQKR